MNTRILGLLALGGILALGAIGTGTASRAMPLAALSNGGSDVVQVYHRGRPHRAYRHSRQRIVVYPGGYAYPDYYATSRGFQDPGFAVRGNIPGCAADLGYGRWESCDK